MPRRRLGRRKAGQGGPASGKNNNRNKSDIDQTPNETIIGAVDAAVTVPNQDISMVGKIASAAKRRVILMSSPKSKFKKQNKFGSKFERSHDTRSLDRFLSRKSLVCRRRRKFGHKVILKHSSDPELTFMVTRAQLEEWKLHKGPDADEIQEKHLTQPQLKGDVSTFDSPKDLQNLSISSEKLEELIEKFELKVSHSLIENSDLSYLSEIETEGSNDDSLDLEDEDNFEVTQDQANFDVTESCQQSMEDTAFGLLEVPSVIYLK